VLLFGYRHLSDGAKLTYEAIDSFDWEDQEGVRKGYAYPSISRVARGRGVSDRTIQRHLAELEAVGLLERQTRPNETSVLIINEPSEEEIRKYLASLDRQRGDKYVTPPQPQVGGDKNVTPSNANSESKKFKPVNEDKPVKTEGSRGSEPIGQLLPGYAAELTKKRQDPTYKVKREYLAQEMLRVLGDEHSLGFYRRVAKRVPTPLIFEALGIVKEIAREGNIRKSRGALFVKVISTRADLKTTNLTPLEPGHSLEVAVAT
jgi:hypothetical protein